MGELRLIVKGFRLVFKVKSAVVFITGVAPGLNDFGSSKISKLKKQI